MDYHAAAVDISPHVIVSVSVISGSTLVSISRLYLGVHSPADIVAGLIPGTILLLLFLSLDDWIYNSISHSSQWGKFCLHSITVLKFGA